MMLLSPATVLTAKDFCHGLSRERQAELLTKLMQSYLDSVYASALTVNEALPLLMRSPGSGLSGELTLG